VTVFQTILAALVASGPRSGPRAARRIGDVVALERIKARRP